MGNVVRLLPPPATLTSFFPVPLPSSHTHTPAKSYVPIAAAPVSVPRLQLHLPQKGNAHASVAEFGVVVVVAVPAAVVPVFVVVSVSVLLLLLSADVVGGIVVVVVVLVSSPFLCRRPSSLPLSLSSSSASSSSGRVAMAITTDSCGSPSGSEPTPPSFALPTYASALPRSCRQLPERVRLLMLLHQCVLCC